MYLLSITAKFKGTKCIKNTSIDILFSPECSGVKLYSLYFQSCNHEVTFTVKHYDSVKRPLCLSHSEVDQRSLICLHLPRVHHLISFYSAFAASSSEGSSFCAPSSLPCCRSADSTSRLKLWWLGLRLSFLPTGNTSYTCKGSLGGTDSHYCVLSSTLPTSAVVCCGENRWFIKL